MFWGRLCFGIQSLFPLSVNTTRAPLAGKTLPVNSLPPNMAATNLVEVKCHFTYIRTYIKIYIALKS